MSKMKAVAAAGIDGVSYKYHPRNQPTAKDAQEIYGNCPIEAW